MSRAYVFEVDDSDGYDSTQVIESAPDERTAKRRAIARHLAACHPYTLDDPDAGPFVWATLADTVAA